MTQFSDNYPKTDALSDAELKQLAIQNMGSTQTTLPAGFPTEIISLPSEGKVYPSTNPFSLGKIEMKYMTAREEDILTSANLIKQGVVLDRLMESLIVTPGNFDSLVVGDKNAVMVAARILGYGKEYQVSVKCPVCEKETIINVDLTTLPEKHIPESAVMVEPGVFEFTLPYSSRKILFRLMTTGIDKKIDFDLEQQRKSKKFNDGIDRELSTRLKYLIVGVDGNRDQKAINAFVDFELFAKDSRALRSYMKDISPDIEFNHAFQCENKSCGHREEAIAFSIDSNFFWPKA